MQIDLYESAPAADTLMVAEEGGCFRLADPKEILWAAQVILLERIKEEGPPMNHINTVNQFLRLKLGVLDHEVFVVLYLNSRMRLIEFEELFRGTLTQTVVHAREVVKRCLQLNAAAVIFAHNHPSGDTAPSRNDERLTQHLQSALALVDVRVLDHLVVSASSVTSMAAMDLI